MAVPRNLNDSTAAAVLFMMVSGEWGVGSGGGGQISLWSFKIPWHFS